MCQNARAACTGSSPTWTTDGNEQADVEECIAAASSGDTINVIAGDGEATWVKLTISKPLKIIGPGASNLRVLWAPDLDPITSNAIMVADIDDWEVSGFTFKSTSDVFGYCLFVRGSKGWRIHHNTFETYSAEARAHLVWVGLTTSNDVNGLIDNNISYNGRIYNTGNSANQAMWGALWKNDYPLGMAGNGNAIYIEDNTFFSNQSSETATGNVLDANRGSRTVFRYNTVRRYYVMQHAISDIGRGPRTWEIYGNDLDRVDYNPSSGMYGIFFRGGTGVIHSNKIVNYNEGIRLNDDRSNYSDALKPASDNTSVTSRCDGDNWIDGNVTNPATGYVDGWPCRDQIGRGADATLWTTVNSTAGPAQASQPAYLWLNYDDSDAIIKATFPTDTNTSWDNNVTGLTAAHIKTNRDFFDYNPDNTTGSIGTVGNNATGGVGCGPARPATCTVDAGYWETTQSCSDIAGMVGASPITLISGTLYKCTATDTWTEYYEPYTYPHPLRTEVSDVVAPASPTGLAVS